LKIKKNILYLLIIIMLIFAQQGRSQEVNDDNSPEEVSVGKILSVENAVTVIKTEEEEIIAKPDMPLFAGDRIITGEKSSVRFTLNEGSNFMIGESSEVAIDEYTELAQESDEESSVLRLAAGFLRSVITELKGESAQPAVYTPTAVAGVRGTAFDTVVSLDGATVVVVDEGIVELENETGKTVLDKGKMAELDEETKDLKPVNAIPQKERNWKAWCDKRETVMMKKFPQMLSKHRKGFEKCSDQYDTHNNNVKKTKESVIQASEDLKQAEESGNHETIQNCMKQLEERTHTLKKAVKESRHNLNKSRAIENYMLNIGKYFDKHKSRFNAEELLLIQSDIESVREKGKHLKAKSRDMLKELKKSLKKERKLKKFREKFKEKREEFKEKKNRDKEENHKEKRDRDKEENHKEKRDRDKEDHHKKKDD